MKRSITPKALAAFAFGTLHFFALPLFAQDFKGIETPDMRFVPPTVCRSEYAKLLLDSKSTRLRVLSRASLLDPEMPSQILSLFEWVPDGTNDTLSRPQCDPRGIEAAMRKSKVGTQARIIRGYFSVCSHELSRKAPGALLALGWLGGLQYDICDSPSIRKVVLRLGSGETIRGLLALKPGTTKRPLVIVRSGVFSNTGDTSHRAMLMHLFDESPFNVLALASTSGADYVRDNGHISLGGFEEGQQAIHLAKLVKASPLSKRVSSLHYVGVSLGGHGALFTGYLNEHNPEADGGLPYASSLAVCPVVDLEDSLRGLFDDSLIGVTAASVFVDTLGKILTFVPKLVGAFPTREPSRDQIPSLVFNAAARYYSTRTNEKWLPPFQDLQIRSAGDFTRVNRFSSLASRPIKTPMLAIAAQDDDLVRYSVNGARLDAALQKVDAKTHLKLVSLPRGSHCAFNVTYGWQTVTSLLRGFILSNSPEYRPRQLAAAIPPELISNEIELWETESFVGSTFSFDVGQATMQVTFRIFATHPKGCPMDPVFGKSQCFREEEMEIPFAYLRGAAWARVPRTQTEAQALTRWANSNLRFADAQGRPLSNSREMPSRLIWTQ